MFSVNYSVLSRLFTLGMLYVKVGSFSGTSSGKQKPYICICWGTQMTIMLFCSLPKNLVEINVSLAADQDRHPLQLWISWYPPKALQFWPLPLSLCWCEKVKVLNLHQFSRYYVNLCILIFILYFPGIAFCSCFSLLSVMTKLHLIFLHMCYF